MDPVLEQNGQELHVEQGGFTGYRLATDLEGEIVYRQAVSYMRELDAREWSREGILEENSDVARLVEKGEELEEGDWFPRYEEALALAREESLRRSQEENDQILTDGTTAVETVPLEFRDPLKPCIELKKRELKELLFPEGIGKSPAASGELLSSRGRREGMAILDDLVPDDSEESRKLFLAYLLEKFSCYPKEAETFPALQLEYILVGGASDEDNATETARRIFLLMEGINLGAVLSDSGLRSQVEGFAAWICESYLVQPDRETVEQAVRYAWVFGESLLKTRLLLAGESAATGKNAGAFLLSLEDLPLLPERLSGLGTSWSSGGEGVRYKELLYVFLDQMEKGELLTRAMDVMEQVKRKAEPSFCLDSCITDVEIHVKVRANLKKTFEVRRIYGYTRES